MVLVEYGIVSKFNNVFVFTNTWMGCKDESL
jgi:hypothetical protein